MNSHRNVAWREARNFRDGSRIHVFQIKNDDLAIERFEPQHHRREAVQVDAPVGRRLPLGPVWKCFELFQREQPREETAFADDVRSRYVMGDAVNPRPQGATAIEALKAPPQLKMNVLGKIAALFRIGFVSSSEAIEGGSESIYRLPVQGILIRWSRRDCFAPAPG